jgi:hypothetical protein
VDVLVAVTLKVVFVPLQTVVSNGCAVIVGVPLTVTRAAAAPTVLHALETKHV